MAHRQISTEIFKFSGSNCHFEILFFRHQNRSEANQLKFGFQGPQGPWWGAPRSALQTIAEKYFKSIFFSSLISHMSDENRTVSEFFKTLSEIRIEMSKLFHTTWDKWPYLKILNNYPVIWSLSTVYWPGPLSSPQCCSSPCPGCGRASWLWRSGRLGLGRHSRCCYCGDCGGSGRRQRTGGGAWRRMRRQACPEHSIVNVISNGSMTQCTGLSAP